VSAPTAAQVREALREYVKDLSCAVEADYTLFNPLARQLLGVDHLEQRDRGEREAFAGQVRRGLNKLAADGTLVKISDGHRAEYRTPAVHEQLQREEEQRETAQAAWQARVTTLRQRIRALGIGGVNYTDRNRMVMDMDMVEALVALAEAGREGT
jgi:hypothetical protein